MGGYLPTHASPVETPKKKEVISVKVLVLAGSPHSKGTTAFLADEFCIGAEEAGHEVVRFEIAGLKVHPCIGCYHCRRNGGKCVYDDDMTLIYPHLLAADVVVLVTPLYYFGMTAQLKCAVDRFFSVNAALREAPRKLFLIAAGADKDDWAMDALKMQVHTVCRYLNWQESGMLLALSANSRGDVEKSGDGVRARRLGKEL